MCFLFETVHHEQDNEIYGKDIVRLGNEIVVRFLRMSKFFV